MARQSQWKQNKIVDPALGISSEEQQGAGDARGQVLYGLWYW